MVPESVSQLRFNKGRFHLYKRFKLCLWSDNRYVLSGKSGQGRNHFFLHPTEVNLLQTKPQFAVQSLPQNAECHYPHTADEQTQRPRSVTWKNSGLSLCAQSCVGKDKRQFKCSHIDTDKQVHRDDCSESSLRHRFAVTSQLWVVHSVCEVHLTWQMGNSVVLSLCN